MRKLFVPVLSAACILALASLASAGTTQKSAGASHRMLGEVVSVDAAANTFTIKETVKGGEAKEVTFTFDEKGKVFVHGKPGTLQDVKAGDSVTVRYTEKEGRNIAEELRIAKPAESKASNKS